MRTLVTAFTLVVVVNLIAAAAFAGWLGASGRLSKERVQQTVDTYRVTVAAQQEQDAEVQQALEEQEAREEQALRMEQVAGGPLTPEQVLDSLHEVDAYYDQIIKRREAEVAAMQQQIDTTRRLVDERFAQLESEREAFAALRDRWVEQSRDEDFQQAVSMLEGVPPKQAKMILQELLDQGEEDQVVAYLAAMDPRKANGVLKEFKQPAEVVQAARLIEQVRVRSGQALQEVGL